MSGTEVEVAAGEPLASVEEVDLDEGRRLLDEAARKLLHMSGEEFIAAWDDGRITDSDSLRVQQVAALLPFAR